MLKAALIITTYNWPEALRLLLKSVLDQSRVPDEVVVADDGSGPETSEVVREILGPSDLQWRHVRHADSGIRQARIKNLGVRNSVSDYLVFVDHDVILHPEFMVDHLSMAAGRTFLQGKRSFLPESYTREALSKRRFKPPSPFLPHLENRKNAFRFRTLGRILSRPKGFQVNLRGCNLSMHREDFLRVDGYDEVFDQLWGREDSDICYRLFHNRVWIRNIWFAALQFHLYHEVIKRTEKDRLDEELMKIRSEKRRQAKKGFSTLSSEGEVIAASRGSKEDRAWV
jgi:glycosyltransferase involved in cell wall biosynthesis